MSKGESEKKYRYYDTDFIKKIPLKTILEDYGKTVRKGFFAVRDERTPSCKIYESNNTWADFGGGDVKGGTSINLVMAVEGKDYKEAVCMLGERYDAPLLHGEKDKSARKLLSHSDYELLGVVASPVYANILKVEYADNLSYEQVQSMKASYSCSMNELFKSDIHTYEAILKQEALPAIKQMGQAYMYQLYTCHKFTQAGDVVMMALSKDIAQERYDEYKTACVAFKRAVKNTSLEDEKIHIPNMKDDLSQVPYRSIEIGEYPYSELKKSGPLHHLKVSEDAYYMLNKSVSQQELEMPLFSVHIKGDEVTVSFQAEQEATFKGMFNSINAVLESRQEYEAGLELN